MNRRSAAYSGDAGYVYILQDPEQINRIKIGRSLDPLRRIEDLYGTSSPAKLQLRALWASQDSRFLEDSIQRMFESRRIAPNREWFRIAPVESFSAWDRDDPESIEAFLDELVSQVNDAISDTGTNATFIPIEDYFQRVANTRMKFPSGASGY